jgi:hypothetical protein
MIDKLSGGKKRRVGEYLKIDKEYFTKDYLIEILDNLLKGSDFYDENVLYEKVIYTPDKITLNYRQSDVEGVLNEYKIFFEDGVFNNIENILQGYDDEEQNRIKIKILCDFNDKTSSSFKERSKTLTEFYLGRYSTNDDDYLFFIRAVLIYFFEQCLIGKKTEAEK